ncbi:TetR/AcrR family transcriptional regulator [Singulisphaera sp. PoT]|uniref:TetR/AcrR family transcriptional regulator n=1 Tax=Singulisphaera sp. PoT TaxID=3411797 RepID=UPI003BF586C7
MRSGRPRGFERQEAIDAALKAFWEQGFENTSMADLERCVGVGRQSLYNILGDKRSLFLEALKRYIERFSQPQIDLLLHSPTPDEGIRRWVDEWLLRTPPPACGCFVANTLASPLASDPDVRAILEEHLTRLKDAIEGSIVAFQARANRTTVLEPRALAETLMVLHQGRGALAKVATPDNQALRQTVEHLLGGCL